MVKFKNFLASCGFVILTVVVMGVFLAFDIFYLVAIGVCGSDCPTKLSAKRTQMFTGSDGNYDFWTPLLVSTVLMLASSLLSIITTLLKVSGHIVVKVLNSLIGLGSLGVFIWFLVEHYGFWSPSSTDALSSANKNLFLCSGIPSTPVKECIEGDSSNTYLMYYADVIAECLFYIGCGIVVIGIIAAIVVCAISCKGMKKA